MVVGDLRLYNTRTRAVERFAPLRDNEVRIYVCGLTPSAQAHLGHARSFLFFDLLRRFLRYRGYAVTFVQNVTDIDDRSIARAIETGEDWRAIVADYYAEFKASMRTLGVAEPDVEPYATAFIPQIVTMIEELVASGHAYLSKDGVYYRVSAFARYGDLSNRNLEELEAGARIEIDEHKDDPLDFALWKFAKPGEPHWPSPWGAGRPGWHIECSAMSRAILDPDGAGFDIHGGGADLIFPHHENEIAQSEPLMKHPPMANLWMHGGLLLFDHRKMSKSLGNFEPLSDLLARHDPQAIRLSFLHTGYRKVMNFTEKSIADAQLTLDRIKSTYRSLDPTNEVPGASALLAKIDDALCDDMNTAVALAELLSAKPATRGEYAMALHLLGIDPNRAWLEEPSSAALPDDFVPRLREALSQANVEVSLANGVAPSAEDAIKIVLDRRVQARASKDWTTSDRLRDALLRCGVDVKDSKEGATWTVVKT